MPRLLFRSILLFFSIGTASVQTLNAKTCLFKERRMEVTARKGFKQANLWSLWVKYYQIRKAKPDREGKTPEILFHTENNQVTYDEMDAEPTLGLVDYVLPDLLSSPKWEVTPVHRVKEQLLILVGLGTAQGRVLPALPVPLCCLCPRHAHPRGAQPSGFLAQSGPLHVLVHGPLLTQNAFVSQLCFIALGIRFFNA